MSLYVSAAAAQGSGGGLLLLIGLAIVLGWLASLWAHPFTACPDCTGSPKKFGTIYTKSFDLCRTCNGRGWKVRAFATIFARNRDRL